MSENTQSAEIARRECTCPRTDGYRIKRRTCVAHAEVDAAHWREHDRRKYGTDSPHEPTDEFIVQAFAEGARSLWPDSRDPGWHVTFERWLAKREAQVAADALSQAAGDALASPSTRVGDLHPGEVWAKWLRGRAADLRNPPGSRGSDGPR